MPDALKHISSAISQRLSALAEQAQASVDLTGKVREAVTGAEKNHIISASYRGTTLVVTTDSAAWCAQIRLDQQALIATINRSSEIQFTKLKVKVAAPAAPAASRTP